MAGKYEWTSPNRKWKLYDVKRLPSRSVQYEEGARVMVQMFQDQVNGPGRHYEIYLLANGRLTDFEYGSDIRVIPKYVLDKARSLMQAKLKSTAKKRRPE